MRLALGIGNRCGESTLYYHLRDVQRQYTVESKERCEGRNYSGDLTFRRWKKSGICLRLHNNQIQQLYLQPNCEAFFIIEYQALHYIFHAPTKMTSMVSCNLVDVTKTGFLSKEVLQTMGDDASLLLSPNSFIRESAERIICV